MESFVISLTEAEVIEGKRFVNMWMRGLFLV